MKIKQRPGDFKVQERLSEGYLRKRGEHRVYRVTKRKLTSLEAAAAVADLAGVRASEVGMAGLKDRQGITVQFMSVRGGRPVALQTPDLRIEPAGFADEGLESRHSDGNRFRIIVRGLERRDLDRLDDAAREVRRFGLPNYFDEQRFGNLRHGQGWIALDLMRGKYEDGLKRLLWAHSPHDDPAMRSFKRGLERAWGDWRACHDIARNFGRHRSLFEHLLDSPDNFAGAFTFVGLRQRLIHLYAYQSHIWNRAVARRMLSLARPENQLIVSAIEGPLVFPTGEFQLEGPNEFPIPGVELEDVTDRDAYDLIADVLAEDRLVPTQFRIEGVAGFHLKGEMRRLLVRPHRFTHSVGGTEGGGETPFAELRFDLPRGAYATLVVQRLFGRALSGGNPAERLRRAGHRGRDDQRTDHSGSRGRGGYENRGGQPGGSHSRGGRGHQGDRRQDDRPSGGPPRGGSSRGGDRPDRRGPRGSDRPGRRHD